jgi:hypothetical protein
VKELKTNISFIGGVKLMAKCWASLTDHQRQHFDEMNMDAVYARHGFLTDCIKVVLSQSPDDEVVLLVDDNISSPPPLE